jgi:hypothetical protein
MNLFHVSSKVYDIGATIGPYSETTFTKRRMADPQYVTLERTFDGVRPSGGVSRRAAVFAFDSVAACEVFWDGESCGMRPADYAGSARYYRVSALSPRKAPFKLVGHAFFRLQRALPYEEIAAEYWRPLREWGWWEYLASAFKVEEVVEATSDAVAQGLVLGHLANDGEQARKLWKL